MKKIAITMGDPGGIGPEVVLKALQSSEIRKLCNPLVIGSRAVLEDAISLLKIPLKIKVIKSPEEAVFQKGIVELIDVEDVRDFEKGKATVSGGKACVAYIKKAVELAMDKKVEAIVTAPISKEAIRMAEYQWSGHTEMLTELTGTKDYAMMLVGGPLRVILVTIHTPLKIVPSLIKKERVLKTILLAKKACDMMGIQKPLIAVAGLNPHAGEAGMFGDEEACEIMPAIDDARQKEVPVSGPYPPDTIFHKAYKGTADIIVSMYHDQGLIPLKMIAFDEGVNVTVGLPIIRTSPDHGTAYDIAWKGMANPSSMIEAIKMAVRLKI